MFSYFIDTHICYAKKTIKKIDLICNYVNTTYLLWLLTTFIWDKFNDFMKKKMIQFVSLEQATPDKRVTGERKKDFHEI